MIELTYKQERVLNTVRDYITVHGFPPTRVELAAILGVYPNAVDGHMRALVKKGVMTSMDGKTRTTLPIKGVRYKVKVEA